MMGKNDGFAIDVGDFGNVWYLVVFLWGLQVV
jgi:hypothetical protein